MRIKVKQVRGKGRGKKLRVPTYNFSIPDNLQLTTGVYAGWLYTDGQSFPVAIHYGPRPVFDEEDYSLEAHIISQSLPPPNLEAVELEFVSRIREVMNFPHVEDMLKQIQSDIANIKKLLASV